MADLRDQNNGAYQKTTGPTSFVQIYALGENDGKTIKLGKSHKTKVRKEQHERRGPNDVRMHYLCSWWGAASDESYLKRYFKHLALPNRTEWFTRDDEMSSWLSHMMKQPFVATELDDIDAMERVDSSYWLPGPANRIAEDRTQQLPLFPIGGADPFADLRPDEIGDGDFYSPRDLIEAARRCFGTIDLDPASCRVANSLVKARYFFSKKENGLSQPWAGKIWINPPYPWEPWVYKLINELDRGCIVSLIALSETRVTTAKYFHPIIQRCSALLKMNGRLKFWGPKAGTPDEGHELFFFGSDPDAFRREFSIFGRVFV